LGWRATEANRFHLHHRTQGTTAAFFFASGYGVNFLGQNTQRRQQTAVADLYRKQEPITRGDRLIYLLRIAATAEDQIDLCTAAAAR
jgi:hypothetical protein